MKTRLLPLYAMTALSLAACGGTDASIAADAAVPASVSLARSSVLASAGVAMANDLLGGGGAPITAAQIDSLIVHVTRVDVLPDSLIQMCHPPVGDSLEGFHPGGPDDPRGHQGMGGPGGRPAGDPMFGPQGPCGRGPDGFRPPPPMHERNDSTLPPDSGWGSRPDHWYALAVKGSGRVDLMHLPSDSTNGLLLAADSIPAGDYVAARLVIDSATIWLNTAFTNGAVTLNPNTGYLVKLPRRHGGTMGIMTNAGFTVPTGGASVVLVFDTAVAIRGAFVTDSGQVVLGPMLHPREH
jgi:hypothetical protein